MQAAIREEIAAGKESIKSTWLDIDAIEHLSDIPSKFVYRLVLSTPMQVGAEQTVTFETRSPRRPFRPLSFGQTTRGSWLSARSHFHPTHDLSR